MFGPISFIHHNLHLPALQIYIMDIMGVLYCCCFNQVDNQLDGGSFNTVFTLNIWTYRPGIVLIKPLFMLNSCEYEIHPAKKS